MDFTNHGTQQTQAGPGAGASNRGGSLHRVTVMPGWLKIISLVLLFSLTILAVSIVGLLWTSNANETKLVNDKKLQAVFLISGQVYFGNVKNISSKYMDLRNIYYLNTQTSANDKDKAVTATNLSLVKLGCEVHAPSDQMIIERDQVIFWENLRDDGQVAQSVAKWKQQNPNGQKCPTPATGDQTQPTGNTNQPTTTKP